MVLDDGKMESMLERFFDAPCVHCEHRFVDNYELKCPLFENNIIPHDIVTGENKHIVPHQKQIKEGTFIEREWKFDK